MVEVNGRGQQCRRASGKELNSNGWKMKKRKRKRKLKKERIFSSEKKCNAIDKRLKAYNGRAALHKLRTISHRQHPGKRRKRP